MNNDKKPLGAEDLSPAPVLLAKQLLGLLQLVGLWWAGLSRESALEKHSGKQGLHRIAQGQA